ncbi:unnamed protein product [Heterobilharzia americana]|nr:unnamed protein product [Heterobilharzia americana]
MSKSARIGKARQAFISLKPVWRSSALSMMREQDPDFQHQLQSSQCSCMAERLGALRKGFPTNYRHSSRTFYAVSILKIRWPERISNKELWERTNQEPITQQICRRKWRWIGHALRRPTGDITRQVRLSSGTQMGSDELGVRGEGDMEEIVRGGNESLRAVVEPG